MKTRNDPSSLLPGLAQERSRLNPPANGPDLIDLARLRVAQIHGCETGQAHYAEKLRRAGESNARLERVENWAVSLVFTTRERTALALAELLAESLPGDEALFPHLLRQAQDHLTREELVRLVLGIEAMQDWKREEANA